MSILLSELPNDKLTPDEVSALSNRIFDYADKERVSMRAAKAAIKKRDTDEVTRRNLQEANKIFDTHFDTTPPYRGPNDQMRAATPQEIRTGDDMENFTLGERAFQGIQGINRGTLNFLKLPGQAAKMLGENLPNRQEREQMRAEGKPIPGEGAIAASNMVRKGGNAWINWMEKRKNLVPESMESADMRQQPFMEAPVFQSAMGAAESAAPYAAAIAASVMTKNPNIGLVLIGASTTGSTYEMLREANVDPDLALPGAMIAGAIEILTEKVPMDMLLKGSVKPLLIRALQIGTAESFQELFAQLGQNYVEAVVKDIDPEDVNYKTLWAAAHQEWDIITEGWQVAMGAGFFMGAGGGMFSPGGNLGQSADYKGPGSPRMGIFSPTPSRGRTAKEMASKYGPSPQTNAEFNYLVKKIRGEVKSVAKSTQESEKAKEGKVAGVEGAKGLEAKPEGEVEFAPRKGAKERIQEIKKENPSFTHEEAHNAWKEESEASKKEISDSVEVGDVIENNDGERFVVESEAGRRVLTKIDDGGNPVAKGGGVEVDSGVHASGKDLRSGGRKTGQKLEMETLPGGFVRVRSSMRFGEPTSPKPLTQEVKGKTGTVEKVFPLRKSPKERRAQLKKENPELTAPQREEIINKERAELLSELDENTEVGDILTVKDLDAEKPKVRRYVVMKIRDGRKILKEIESDNKQTGESGDELAHGDSEIVLEGDGLVGPFWQGSTKTGDKLQVINGVVQFGFDTITPQKTAPQLGIDHLFKEMETGKVTVHTGMDPKIIAAAQEKADTSRKERFVWIDQHGKVHSTTKAPEKFAFRRIKPKPLQADLRKEADAAMDPKRRTQLRKKFKAAILSNPMYQAAVQKAEDVALVVQTHLGGVYSFPADVQGDVDAYLESHPEMKKRVSPDGQPYDDAWKEYADEVGIDESPDPTEFLETIRTSTEAGKKDKLTDQFVRDALDSDPVAILDWIGYDMAGKGFSEADILAEIKQTIEDRGLETQGDVTLDRYQSGELFNVTETEGIPQESDEAAELAEDDDFSGVFGDFQEESQPVLTVEAAIEKIENHFREVFPEGTPEATITEATAKTIGVLQANADVQGMTLEQYIAEKVADIRLVDEIPGSADTMQQKDDPMTRRIKKEGLFPAIRDPKTWKIYGDSRDYNHDSVIRSAEDPEVRRRLRKEYDRIDKSGYANPNVGYMNIRGRFITEEEANKRFNIWTSEDILFQRDALWYSQAERIITDKMPGKMTVADFKKWLKKQSIKKEELQWSGLLDIEGDKVTKQQVLDTLAENRIVIEEVEKGVRGGQSFTFDEINIRENAAEDMIQWAQDNIANEDEEVFETYADAVSLWRQEGDATDGQTMDIIEEASHEYNDGQPLEEWLRESREMLEEVQDEVNADQPLPGDEDASAQFQEDWEEIAAGDEGFDVADDQTAWVNSDQEGGLWVIIGEPDGTYTINATGDVEYNWTDYQHNGHPTLESAQEESDRILQNEMQPATQEGYTPYSPTKFPTWVLPGGKNYRELLLRMPEKAPSFDAYVKSVNTEHYANQIINDPARIGERGMKMEWQGYLTTLHKNGVTHLDYHVIPDPKNGPLKYALRTPQGATIHYNMTLAEAYEEARRYITNTSENTGQFHSAHFDETNILVHIRYNDRTGPNGERILHIEEFQSDWHQAGRKKGYNGERIQGLPDGWKTEWDDGSWYLIDAQGDEILTLEGDTPQTAQGSAEAQFVEMIQEAIDDGIDIGYTLPTNGVPDAPFKGSTKWGLLAFKRMLRYAAENGYDMITWTTGEQQVERYKEALRKAVDKVEWIKTTKGVQLLGYKNGIQVVDTVEKETELSDAIGKSMGDKILSDPAQKGIIEGDDITVSDTGMAGFYDRIIKKEIQKYTKKWGGKVGMVNIAAPTEGLKPQELLNIKRVIDEDSQWYHPSGTHQIRDNANGTKYSVLEDDGNNVWTKTGEYDTVLAAVKAVDTATGFTGHKVMVHSLPITPEMSASALKGQPMFQGEKGAIEFLADGRAIIYAVKGAANLSTLIHETGHFFRRQLTPDMNRLALKDMGFEEWTTQAEEKFARLWERWNRDGVAPTEVLREMFTMFREWLVGVYSQIKGSPIEAEVSPAMKTVFESLLVKQERTNDMDRLVAGLEQDGQGDDAIIKVMEAEYPDLTEEEKEDWKRRFLFQMDEEIGTGNAKVRGTSVSVVAKAIKDEIISDNANISGLPEQNQMNMAEQADKALKLIQSDIDKAVRIAFYQEAAPEGLYPENVFTALRVWAKMAGDAELIMKLATDEGGARVHTILGKRIKSLDTGEDFADPIAAIQQIIAARKEKDIRDRTEYTQLELQIANLEAELAKHEAAIGTQKQRTVRKARSNYGKGNKVVSRSEYDDILARRRHPDRLYQADTAYTPNEQDFIDMAKIGMFHLEALGQDYEKWAYQMSRDLGDWTESHLKKEYTALLSRAAEAGIEIPESKRLTAKKKRLTTMGKKIEAQLDRLDLEVAPRIPIALDPVGQRLQEEYNQIKAKLNAARAAANLITTEEVENITVMSREVAIRKEKMETGRRRKDPGLAPTQVEIDFGAASWAFRQYVGDLKKDANKRTFTQYFRGNNWHIDLISDIGNTAKSLVLSLDNSFHGNQGLVSFYRGITGDLKSARIWATTFAKSFKMIWATFKGKDPIAGIYGQIISDPYYDLIKRTKISLFTTEEDIPTDLPTKIPVIGQLFKAGANAFEGSTYYQRYQLAVKYIQIYEKSGRKLDKATLEEIGQIVDTMTLRGKISQTVGKGKGAGFINAVFISPRNIRASFDILTAHLFSRNISMRGRMLAAGNMVRFAVGSHMLLLLAWLIDDEAVTWDPTNADYGKIKVGNTRFSVMGPFGSLITLIARGYTGVRTSSTTGRRREINKTRYGDSTSDLVWDFTKNKFSPLTSTVQHMVDRRMRDGEDWNAMQALRDMTTPIMVQAYFETASAEDAADMWLILIAEALGIRVMTYGKRTGKEARKKRESF